MTSCWRAAASTPACGRPRTRHKKPEVHTSKEFNARKGAREATEKYLDHKGYETVEHPPRTQ